MAPSLSHDARAIDGSGSDRLTGSLGKRDLARMVVVGRYAFDLCLVGANWLGVAIAWQSLGKHERRHGVMA